MISMWGFFIRANNGQSLQSRPSFGNVQWWYLSDCFRCYLHVNLLDFRRLVQCFYITKYKKITAGIEILSSGNMHGLVCKCIIVRLCKLIDKLGRCKN